MSKLNDEIKPWLLVNGFKEIDGIPRNVTHYTWDYQYHNSEYFVYFDEGETCIKARYHNDTPHALWRVSAEQVIAYFTKHGNVPVEAPKQATINTAPDTAVSNEGRTMPPLEWEQHVRDLNNAIQAANCTELNRSNIFQAIKSSAFDGAVAFYQPHLLTLIDDNGQLIITVNLNNPHWLQHIELVTGKLTVPNAVAQKLLLG